MHFVYCADYEVYYNSFSYMHVYFRISKKILKPKRKAKKNYICNWNNLET